MDIRTLSTAADIEAASLLAFRRHQVLRAALPFLPGWTAAHYAPKIAWVRDHGRVVGLFDAGELQAFLGAFTMENFRNAGPGALAPDWCHGACDVPPFHAYRALYRELAPLLRDRGAPIHAVCLHATDTEALQALAMTGFGRIMMDAARPTAELAAELCSPIAPTGSPVQVRQALPADAEALAELDAGLAAHIAASPVLVPHPRGRTPETWREWLSRPTAVAILAESGPAACGFIKAEEPQFDVTDAVHGPSTLAINGLFVRPPARRVGLATRLLAALVSHARGIGKEMMSVDCETTNLEAYAFWSRHFRPVAWGMERRT